jgi:site-specific recombinase XerD
MLGAGLRVSEVVGLDVRDVILDHDGEGLVHVRQGKGRKDRIVPLRSEVTELLRSYLAATGRALGQFGPLFRAHDRGASLRARRRLAARAVGYVVHEAAARAGIAAKAISPHSLRHTMAIRSLRGGASVVAVSKVLGHASIATTQRYLDHLELGELRAVLPEVPV